MIQCKCDICNVQINIDTANVPDFVSIKKKNWAMFINNEKYMFSNQIIASN